eukprot:451316_1
MKLDMNKLNGNLNENDKDVEDIRVLIFEIIRSIQMDIINKIAFKTIKTEGKHSNPSKVFILSLEIIKQSNNLLLQIIKSDIKNKKDIINNSDLLKYLLPTAIHSFLP